MLETARQGFVRWAWQGRWRIQHTLLRLAQIGHQQQVGRQRMIGSQAKQAPGTAAEQIGLGQVEKRRDVGRGFDLPRLENLV